MRTDGGVSYNFFGVHPSAAPGYAESQLFVGVDALGGNFDFGNTTEREQ